MTLKYASLRERCICHPLTRYFNLLPHHQNRDERDLAVPFREYRAEFARSGSIIVVLGGRFGLVYKFHSARSGGRDA